MRESGSNPAIQNAEILSLYEKSASTDQIEENDVSVDASTMASDCVSAQNAILRSSCPVRDVNASL